MNKPKVLIVEDEAIIALEIKKSLSQLDLTINGLVTSYDDAIKSIHKNKPDLILLDINLKNSKDGIDIANAVKDESDISIIYLTAFSDENTIQRASRTNPIAYLVKPFKREDLTSTILLAIYKLNNDKKVEPELKEIGFGYCYDIEHNNLFFKGYPIRLSSKEKVLLEMLIEAQGNIVPFNVLEDYIWRANPVSESALRTLLYRLRAKMEYKLIETIPSFGCRIKV